MKTKEEHIRNWEALYGQVKSIPMNDVADMVMLRDQEIRNLQNILLEQQEYDPYRLPEYEVRMRRTGNFVEVSCPQNAAEVIRTITSNKDPMVKKIIVLLLDSRKRMIGAVQVAQGGSHHLVISASAVFRPAVVAQAQAVIIGQNHTSGYPEPSPEDHVLSRKLIAVGKQIGIEVVDHVIVDDNNGSFSFLEAGVL